MLYALSGDKEMAAVALAGGVLRLSRRVGGASTWTWKHSTAQATDPYSGYIRIFVRYIKSALHTAKSMMRAHRAANIARRLSLRMT